MINKSDSLSDVEYISTTTLINKYATTPILLNHSCLTII